MTDNIKTFSDLVKNIEKLIDAKLGFETNTSGTKTLYLIMHSKEYLIENFEYETKCRIEFFNFPQSPRLTSKDFNNLFFVIRGLWEAKDER
jgi:hypothetical protein